MPTMAIRLWTLNTLIPSLIPAPCDPALAVSLLSTATTIPPLLTITTVCRGEHRDDLPPTLAHNRYSRWDGGRIVAVSVAGNTANTVWTCAGPRGIRKIYGRSVLRVPATSPTRTHRTHSETDRLDSKGSVRWCDR